MHLLCMGERLVIFHQSIFFAFKVIEVFIYKDSHHLHGQLLLFSYRSVNAMTTSLYLPIMCILHIHMTYTSRPCPKTRQNRLYALLCPYPSIYT